jgi:hypothetical protein
MEGVGGLREGIFAKVPQNSRKRFGHDAKT